MKMRLPPNWPPYYNHFMAHIDRHAPGTFCWVELGTAVYTPPMMVGEGLRIAILADPQGAVFALFSPVK